MKNRGEYLVYVETVRKLTEKTFKKEYIDNKQLRGKDYHLDHKVSIKDCFYNNIPIEFASHICNLQIVSKEYNSKKNSKSSILPYELMEQVIEYESFLE